MLRSFAFPAAFLAAFIPLVAGAQVAQPPVAPDSAVLRAQRMVSLGQGEAGRALLDSIVNRSGAGTPALAEALFWRASLAATEQNAERDYRRIAVEFPHSPRAEDALIRLAQMELTRGNAELAQRHLERLIAEHPVGSARARAGYWLGRAYLQGGDVTRGCSELQTARGSATAAEVQLLAQIDHAAERCTAEAMQVAAGAAAVDPAVAATLPGGAGNPGGAVPPAGANPPVTAPPPAVNNPPVTTTPPPVTNPPVTTPPPAQVAAQPPARAAAQGPEFSVQVAALGTLADAQAMVAQLGQRGHDARVFGAVAPFRIRVGRYATRAEANAAAAQLRVSFARDAFVVEAEPR
jgi:cell division septation protein DedD